MSPYVRSFRLLALIGFLLGPMEISYASPSPSDTAHFCIPLDFGEWERDRSRSAAKPLADLNVGEPRTVRLIYFLPNDRPYRPEVVDSMKVRIRQLQTFYAEQMQAHGYGNKTFRIETDAQGEPLVHRLDGRHPESHYLGLRTYSTVYAGEISQAYDLHANIYFIILDTSKGVNIKGLGGQGSRLGKNGGFSLLTSEFMWAGEHELGHAFGLQHDFRDGAFIMSYSQSEWDRLSGCSAKFLAVHPYFNSDVEVQWKSGPTTELVSPRRYAAGSESVSIQLKVRDPEGLHQVLLYARTKAPHFAAGFKEVRACRGLAGEIGAVVEFDYDGVVPSDPTTNLSISTVHVFEIEAVDMDGDVRTETFTLAELSPHYIATLAGHREPVISVAISPTGATLAAGSEDGTATVWDVSRRLIIATLGEARHSVRTVTFSPDGTTLAYNSSAGGAIKLWDVAAGRQIATLQGHDYDVFSLAFSPDGTMLASGAQEETIKLWDAATGANTANLEGHESWVNSVTFSPDGTMLASGAQDKSIKLWDVATATHRATLAGHESWVNSVTFSPNGTILASGSEDHTVKLWEVETGTQISTLEHGGSVQSVTFSPDGTILASGSLRGTVKLWDVGTGENIATLGNPGGVFSVSFSPDGSTLASGSSDGSVELWDASEWMRSRPSGLVKISGDEQQGAPDAALTHPLVVEVRDQYGDPLPDTPIVFTVTAGDGTLSGRFTVEHTTTDANGRAEGILTLGPDPGTNTVGVSIVGRELVTFNAVGVGEPVVLMDGDFRKWHLPDGAIARLGNGHVGSSDRAVAFSPDGQFLAVASGIGFWLYELATSNPVALLPSAFPVYSASFSPDGATLASGAGDNRVMLWDVATGTEITSLEGHRGIVYSVSFSPDGATLASGAGDNRVMLWDVASGGLSTTLEGHTSVVLSVEFSPDGATLASGANDNRVMLWDVATGTHTATLEGHTEPVYSVTFSRDGATFASASDDGTIKLWDPGTGRNIATLVGHRSRVRSVTFSPDGTTLASGSWDNTVKLWDVRTGNTIATLEVHTDGVRSVSFSPDGTTLVSASEDGTVRTLDLATGNSALFKGHTLAIHAMSFSPDGRTLASGSGDGTIPLWDLGTGKITSILEGHRKAISSVSFSPDGKTLASTCFCADPVKLWDLGTGTNFATLDHYGGVSPVTFSPDGKTLASTSGPTVKLWEVATWRDILTLSGHTNTVFFNAFSPDGQTLVSASWDGTVRLWEVATGTQITSLEVHSDPFFSVAFSPDGTTLASGSIDDGTVKLWDLGSGTITATLGWHRWLQSMAFSPDGSILASGSWPGDHDMVTVKLWDLAKRTNTATLEGHTDEIASLVFSPDGQTLASGSIDGTILLWDMQFFQPRPQTLRKLLGDHQQGVAGTQLARPFVVWVLDQDGSPYAGAAVTFAVTAGDGMLSEESGTTDEKGRVSTTLTLGPKPGTNIVTVTVDDLEPETFTAFGVAVPRTLAIISGEDQQGPAGAALEEPFVVSVLDQNGLPYAGAWVAFAVTAGDGTLSVETATTDSSGRAATTLTLGRKPGHNTVVVTVGDLDPVAFTAVGIAVPRTLTIVSGDDQQGPVGSPLGDPLVISVLDQNGTPYAGAVVTFRVISGDGTVSAVAARTDARGRASTVLTLGGVPGANTVTVTVADLEPEIFTAVAEATPDFDGDGVTNFADFFLFADAFGGTDARFDLDGSGVVDFADFFIFADAFGQPARAKLLALAAKLIGLPEGPQLQQNAPNPFNSQTVISYFMLAPGPARLEVYGLTGQRVAVLHQGPQQAGLYRLHWDGRDGEGRPLASGIYLYRLVTAEGALTRKLVLLR